MSTAPQPEGLRPQCLVYLPYSYTGKGPAESCARLLEDFPGAGFDVRLYVIRARKPLPAGVRTIQAAGPMLSRMPYRWIKKIGEARLDRAFERAMALAPRGSIVWFWPQPPAGLVRRAQQCGLTTIREMINSPLAYAKPLLDDAYRAAGIDWRESISDVSVALENEELALYDHVTASNPEVEIALAAMGIAPKRIIPTSFGWDARRFGGTASTTDGRDRPLRVCFVGTMNVRKGIPVLLEAWRRARIDGELWLAGGVDPCLQKFVNEAANRSSIKLVGHIDDVASFYRDCDIFVFPTHEEGGPQVTYEAAACGLPIVTTPMGAARLVKHDETGQVVTAGDAESLASALRKLAEDSSLRKRCGKRAQEAAQEFEYRAVSERRAQQFMALSRPN